MLNIRDYHRYSGEKKIALMDNSTVSFLEQVECAGISTKELLKDYDAILIPNWVSEESRDDKSTALVAKRTDNQQFKALQDMNVQIIF